MNAQEARELAANGGNINKEKLQKAYDTIKLRAGFGMNHASFEFSVEFKAIAEQLKKDGYDVEHTNDRGESIYIVRW